MSTPYVRAPHQEGPGTTKTPAHTAPNAALLIDFDNVTMGMRSDLSDELKTLLNSDIIKGKVAVQRAYADWRRYPQYIVPLSEASIDLIFAPAYGSNKKNATDIRMAIDGMELVFTRPEIGTFILLTGDSDFSSLVLKLKEYGKYVIGVGIQESSSDILVQNCDEYYSYTSLAGLRKTTESETGPVDPWVLVERALERMESRNDVMRSDRLKQVMMEIDTGFDESEYGFSKFSRFITEASSRGLVNLQKLENGQYEVHPSGGSGSGGAGRSKDRDSGSDGGGGRSGDSGRTSSGGRGRSTRSGRGRSTRSGRSRSDSSSTTRDEQQQAAAESSGEPLQDAYDLLTAAVEKLADERDVPAVRDSDVKRKMLDMDRSFDEAELGFGKFSLFLQQADEHDVIVLRKRESGNYEVGTPETLEKEAPKSRPQPEQPRPVPSEPSEAEEPAASEERAEPESAGAGEADEDEEQEAPAAQPAGGSRTRGGLGIRGGERDQKRKKGRAGADGPPILEGQMVGGTAAPSGDGSGEPTSKTDDAGEVDRSGSGPGKRTPTGSVVDPDDLGLPTDRSSVIRYLANSYRGVGEKTAETLVDELGENLFEVLQRDPSRVHDVVPSNRADQLLDAWHDDLERRKDRLEEPETGAAGGSAGSRDGGSSSGGHGGPPAGGSSAPQRGPDASGSTETATDQDAPEEEDEEDEPEPSRLNRRRGRRTRR